MSFFTIFSAYNSFPSYLVITCVYQFKRTTINHKLKYHPYPFPYTFILCGGVRRSHVSICWVLGVSLTFGT